MKNHRNKKYYEAMEPPKKKIFLEKKKVRDMKKYKQEIRKKTVPKVQNNGYCKETIPARENGTTMQNHRF